MATPRKPVTFTGNSPLAPLMAQFVQEKRACGYRYDECASSLRRFDAYLCRQGLQHVELPRAMMSSWLDKQPQESGGNQRVRINTVRQFAQFMHRLGLPADVPDLWARAKQPKAFLARVLTHDEVRRLLDAAGTRLSRGRLHTCATSSFLSCCACSTDAAFVLKRH